MSSMTSRQRVITALSHKQPDCVPIDLNITLAAYWSRKEYMGVKIENDPAPNIAMEVIPDVEVLDRLGVDLISVKLGGKSNLTALPATIKDDWGVTRQLVQQSNGEYYEAVTHPLAESSIDDLAGYPWPNHKLTEKAELLSIEAQRLYKETSLALVGRFGGAILEIAVDLLGAEQWYIRLAMDKQFIVELLNRISDICTAQDLSGLDAAGNCLQIMKVSGEDFGMQNAPLYSRNMFEDILLPPLKRRWCKVRKKLNLINPEIKIMLHSCGAVSSFIPDFITAGIDILDPVQPLAAGMQPEKLKRKFGKSMVFHGGIDIQNLLPNGTPEEVAAETCQCLEGFEAHQGGFIVAPSHNVQADVPPQNIIAMIDAVKDWSHAKNVNV